MINMDMNPYDTILNKILAEKSKVETLNEEYNKSDAPAAFYFKGEIFAYDKAIKIIKEVVFQR